MFPFRGRCSSALPICRVRLVLFLMRGFVCLRIDCVSVSGILIRWILLFPTAHKRFKMTKTRGTEKKKYLKSKRMIHA